MVAWIWPIFIIIIIQRIVELGIAKRNEKWVKKRGAVEVGHKHYKWFIIVHTLFFMVMLLEIWIRKSFAVPINYLLLTIFILAQLARIWCLVSLGKHWNTKILVIPDQPLIKKGPYKYVKHPNYIIVGVELLVIPLLFHAYVTAILFPILHLILLKIRIPQEEYALEMFGLKK